MIRKTFMLLAATAALAASAGIKPTGVSVSQDPFTHRVTVDYTLPEAAIVTFDVKVNGVSIGGENLKYAYGDVHRKMDAGAHTFWWHPEKAWPGHRFGDSSVKLEVVAWPDSSPPDYMVVDLVASKGARTYYTAPEQLPGDGGVTNRMYKTDYLVFRLIPAKDAIFPMGLRWNDGDKVFYHRVKLTNDFYMAVYELTLGQYRNVTGSDDGKASWIEAKFPDAGYMENKANPIPQETVYGFRGKTKTWKANGHDIDSGAVLQTFRTALNLPNLDLPTESEWEFACRAGTATHRYDGVDVVSGDEEPSTAIAWSMANSRTLSLYGGGEVWGLPNEVGLLAPNAFGLYDTLGNVGEVCLDLYNTGSAYATRVANDPIDGEPMVAPPGPDTDVNGRYSGDDDALYVLRGNSVLGGIWGVVAYERYTIKGNVTYIYHAEGGPYGYRLVFVP